MQPLRLEPLHRLDGFGDVLAGDESARKRVLAAHPVTGRERFQRSAAGERLKKGLGRDIEH